MTTPDVSAALAAHYRAACTLGPRAARIASRLLDSLLDIPAEWRFSLRVALAHREAQGDPELSASDHALLSWVRQEGFEQAGVRAETHEQQSARDFVRQVVHALTRQGDSRAAPRE
ncbi:hypothetical protein [Variovorax ginsengisoli]|uniref:Uncharacterized protein n=1 Tax=Variovorax ginsengisoli TaxID=363844 RepID=A0ABT8S8K0_9BURK|nr:hypothetical protein [Variovorax ginsengisoli]MDN8616059.1 hypothetical protein [Variovorax ginsengisoli]MDO1535229.1 hypothetical protein [Variovorax ginsengisoli]